MIRVHESGILSFPESSRMPLARSFSCAGTDSSGDHAKYLSRQTTKWLNSASSLAASAIIIWKHSRLIVSSLYLTVAT